MELNIIGYYAMVGTGMALPVSNQNIPYDAEITFPEDKHVPTWVEFTGGGYDAVNFSKESARVNYNGITNYRLDVTIDDIIAQIPKFGVWYYNNQPEFLLTKILAVTGYDAQGESQGFTGYLGSVIGGPYSSVIPLPFLSGPEKLFIVPSYQSDSSHNYIIAYDGIKPRALYGFPVEVPWSEFTGSNLKKDYLEALFEARKDMEEPYGPDVSKPSGGYGDGTMGPSDNIADDIPNGTVEANSSAVGLFTRYAMNVGQMRDLADKIYADNFLEKLGLEVTKFLWNSPIDAIISCQSYPFSVTSLVGSSAVNDIKLGAVPTGLSGSALAGSAAKIDWGSIHLEEYWKNFLDYAPHTKIELYLPWSTGFVEIDPHECLPGSISVVTNIEFTKGTCHHIVTGNNGSVIGLFSGACATTLPLTSVDTASKAINVVTAAAGLAVAAATGGAATSAGIAAGIARGSGATLTAKEFASHVAGTKAAISAAERPYKAMQGASLKVAAQSSVAAFRQPPHVVRNGSFNGNGAGMGIQYPFIILSRPTQNVPKNYGHYYGYPSNIYTTLGSVSGYTEVASVHLDGISCTGQEREEIDNLLKGGVIL